MIHYTGIEDLLFATLDAVSRFRVAQRESVSAALDAGALPESGQGAAPPWRIWRMAWKGRPCTANGANLDEASSYGPDGRGSH